MAPPPPPCDLKAFVMRLIQQDPYTLKQMYDLLKHTFGRTSPEWWAERYASSRRDKHGREVPGRFKSNQRVRDTLSALKDKGSISHLRVEPHNSRGMPHGHYYALPQKAAELVQADGISYYDDEKKEPEDETEKEADDEENEDNEQEEQHKMDQEKEEFDDEHEEHEHEHEKEEDDCEISLVTTVFGLMDEEETPELMSTVVDSGIFAARPAQLRFDNWNGGFDVAAYGSDDDDVEEVDGDCEISLVTTVFGLKDGEEDTPELMSTVVDSGIFARPAQLRFDNGNGGFDVVAFGSDDDEEDEEASAQQYHHHDNYREKADEAMDWSSEMLLGGL